MKAVQLNIFGDEEVLIQAKRTRQETFEDYDAFVAKFDKDAPKTTDDCYTPQPIYEAILEWLGEKVDLRGRPIVRPFYPGGDYKNYDYPVNRVVIDNPPFSILAQIIRFYKATKIDYFLFAPALTLFSAVGDCAVVANLQVVYANNAVVNTGFHTSLFGDAAVLVASSLKNKVQPIIDALACKNKLNRHLPKYTYPPHVITAATLHTALGVDDITIKKHECYYLRELDAQKPLNKALFGAGYIISTAKAKEIAKAKETTVWELSKRELKIIDEIDNRCNSFDNRAQASGEA